MKKLLYITDHEEYEDHTFTGSVFEIYLKEYLIVDIVYFSYFKCDFERKDAHRFTVPSRYKNTLLNELKRNDVKVEDYDHVLVRNNINILKHVLSKRKKYDYKVGFRFSFPKRRARLDADMANNDAGFINVLASKIRTNVESKLINECDIFIPTSEGMHSAFFQDVSIKSFSFPAGIDPEILHPKIQHEGEETRFIYSGTLDKLREFEVVLEAFFKLESNKWKLMISTNDNQGASKIIEKYETLKDNVKIYKAATKADLLHLIAKADVGVAILPDKPIFNTSAPMKILNYYSSAVPSIMTKSIHINQIFTDNVDAWFTEFTVEEIHKKLKYIISLPKSELAEVGIKGQERLLAVRNYKDIAKNLADTLEAL